MALWPFAVLNFERENTLLVDNCKGFLASTAVSSLITKLAICLYYIDFTDQIKHLR